MGKAKNLFNMFVTNWIFVSLDFIGAAIILLDALFFHNNATLTTGLTFLTLGLTIPISLYFQSKQSNDSFEIINACSNSGIANVFEGRKVDESYNRLRERIDDSFERAKKIYLCGIAFPELLDPESARGSHAKRQLKNPDVDLRIILLNPDSQAAKRRVEIEDPENICQEGETICNIRHTIDNHLKLLLRARLENKFGQNWRDEVSKMITPNDQSDSPYKTIVDEIRAQFKTTEFDPICFIIATDHFLFSEQYHFGRPTTLESSATCIGGYVPIMQFKKFSRGYEFLSSHFDYIWNNADNTADITEKLLDDIIKGMRA